MRFQTGSFLHGTTLTSCRAFDEKYVHVKSNMHPHQLINILVEKYIDVCVCVCCDTDGTNERKRQEKEKKKRVFVCLYAKSSIYFSVILICHRLMMDVRRP